MKRVTLRYLSSLMLLFPFIRPANAMSATLTTGAAATQARRWTGPDGSIINALVTDPNTPTTIYAASGYHMLYKSTDGGATWNGVHLSNSSTLELTVLAIDPQTPTTMYAGSSGRVSKSTDGGTTWSSVTLPLASVNVLVVDPQTPTTIYAALSNGAGGATKAPPAEQPGATRASDCPAAAPAAFSTPWQ